MREYKFRGQRKDNKKWVYGSLVVDTDGFKAFIQETSFGIQYEVIPETVGQFIGLKDCNSVEIFEHDIVHVYYGVGKVVFNAGCFMIEWIDDKEANMELLFTQNFKIGHRREDLVVTGNIHTNPELLSKS